MMRRNKMMRRKLSVAVLGTLAASTGAMANTFINGAFETGNTSGWTVGQASRNGAQTSALNPSAPALLNGATGRSAIITAGTVDPILGAALGTTVYSGNNSFRVEDTTTGGLLSVISQTVTNYTDANIFFAWKAVLEGAHGPQDSAAMIIRLEDLTAGTTVISRTYNGAGGGGGVDPRFTFGSNFYYTPQWQIEQLAIGPALQGHDFRLSVLATDCAPTGHRGYVYLDGFGAVTPPPVDPGPTPAPVPATLALMGAGLLGMGSLRRKQK
jgi:PEP-CTERM motif